MTFEAQNNNIVVTDTNGAVVFDTGTPMPHIAQVVTANVIHQFPESGDQVVATDSYTISAIVSSCRDFQYVCNTEYVCEQVYVCGYEYQCNYEYVCEYNYATGRTECGYQQVCGNVYVCGYEQQCGYQQVCGNEWVDVQGYETVGGNKVLALEQTDTYTLGSVPAGTNPDFALVLMTATRTATGSHHEYGAFISAIPAGQQIAANGSTVLETAFQPGGQPWLSRIVSVFLDGDTVKAEFKHSNREYLGSGRWVNQSCFGYPSAYAPPDNTASTWDITFEVYAGKFTT